MLSLRKTWWEVVIGAGIGIGCIVFMLVNAGCSSSQGAVTCAPVHSESCAKAVASGIQVKTGSGRIACAYEHTQAGHMQCFVLRRPWTGTMLVYVRDNRWHVTYIVMPDNTREKAPLSGTIT